MSGNTPNKAKVRARNVFGEPLVPCCFDPMTGYFRDGSCHTDENDLGSHTVCVEVTADFLNFSLQQGNDLVTPRPHLGFPGLRPGDSWCVCALRWLDAQREGHAAPIKLESTNLRALDYLPMDVLTRYALESEQDFDM